MSRGFLAIHFGLSASAGLLVVLFGDLAGDCGGLTLADPRLGQLGGETILDDAWQAALARIVRIPPAADENGYAHPIPLGESARRPMEAAAQHWVTVQKRSDPTERDVIARARQQAMRLSAVIALLEHALTEREGAIEEVTGADVERGIALIDAYFLPMAARTFALAGAPRESDALRLARHLKRLGRPTLSVRDDITRGAGSPVRNAAAVAEAIAELKARGLVREAPRELGALGRPGVVLAVHPALLTA